MLAKLKSKQPLFDLAAWRYFFGFYREKRSTIALASIASVFQAVLILPVILLVRFAFDTAIPEKNISLLIKIGFVILGFNLLSAAVSIWVKHLNIRTIHSVIVDLREHLLFKLYCFSRRFYTDEDLKVTHTRIVQDTERLSNLSHALISKFVPSLFLSLTLCFALVFINGFLFLALLSLFPVLFFFHRHMGKQVHKKVYVFQRAFEAFSRGIFFTLRFMDLTRIQTAENEELDKQRAAIRHLAATSEKMHFYYALNGQLHTLITGFSGIFIIILGGAAIARGAMSVGDLFSFYLATGYLYRHVAIVTDAFIQIVAGNASLVTLRELADTDRRQPEFGRRKIDFTGAISFHDVSFQYDSRPLLKNINFKIMPGQKMAIVGSNGSGKTTLIHLILGFYAPLGGEIKADGVSYPELDIHHLRRSIGVVMQDPLLFSGSVRENISFGACPSDVEPLIQGSHFSFAHEFIRNLPDGYDTRLGEEGSMFSGGQRQKVATARALLRRPRLLILDEPTNHLDAASVRRLMLETDRMEHKPAILMVSHDREVIRQADMVLTLENGTLITCEN